MPNLTRHWRRQFGVTSGSITKASSKRETKKIEMMLETTTREVELSHVEISATDGTCSLEVEVTKVDKGELLFLDNLKYQQIIRKNSHLNEVHIDNLDTKENLPIHLILGASEYAKLKTETAPKIGQVGKPIAELTRFGWTIISHGQKFATLSHFMTSGYKRQISRRRPSVNQHLYVIIRS